MNTRAPLVAGAHTLRCEEPVFRDAWSHAALRQSGPQETERPRVALRRGAVSVVPSAGFEPATSCSGGKRSIP
ncbi:hypothetical protein RHRU231_960193 [Rhodococcus ruber]|uniref:Uncharacterized protein n=1 Tax=Rhodococcus ruber TaxID=1830 RepID=A0A098BVB2_9NOCA|nr:hypothetical protein RHRU231_960193 [Rhodococcus ruber]